MFPLKCFYLTLCVLTGLGIPHLAFAQTYPELGFETRPSYLPNNAIALTFDDGPDDIYTAKILDVLRDKNVKATFFINAHNQADLLDVKMQELLHRIVNEGHTLANHTDHHLHLPTLSSNQIEEEIMAVEHLTKQILGSDKGTLTLLRAPFGEPFQDNFYSPIPEYQRIAPIFARHGVHIGWNIDAYDYDCREGDAFCVFDNVTSKMQTPGNGDFGLVLMHSIYSHTAEALPGIIDYGKSRGFQFWSVEQAVVARFGKSSAELVAEDSQVPPECQSPAWQQGHFYKIGEKVVFEDQVFTAQNEDNPGYNPKISTWFWAAGPLCK